MTDSLDGVLLLRMMIGRHKMVLLSHIGMRDLGTIRNNI